MLREQKLTNEGLNKCCESMGSLALIVHPSAAKPNPEALKEEAPEDRGLRTDPVLMRHRTFRIGELQLNIEQTWATATENECTGHAVWQGAIHLAQFLAHDQALAKVTQTLQIFNGRSVPQSVTELGCGVGCLPSVICAMKRGMSGIVLTDQHASVLTQAERNMRNNLGHRFVADEDHEVKVSYHKLTWGDMAQLQNLPQTDLIIGADIAYHMEAHEALLDTLEALLAKGGFALLCHPERYNSHEVLCARVRARDGLTLVDLDTELLDVVGVGADDGKHHLLLIHSQTSCRR